MTAPDAPLDAPVPPLPGAYPGSWEAMPVEVRRYLTARLLTASLSIHEGPTGLIKWLYAGTTRPAADGSPLRMPFTTQGIHMYSFVLEDAAAWVALGAPVPLPPTLLRLAR